MAPLSARILALEQAVKRLKSQQDATHRLALEFCARLGITSPATQPVRPAPPASSSSGILLARQSDPLPCPVRVISPVSAKPAPTASVVQTAPSVAPRAKTFSYPCRHCGNASHWTKDCPHLSDVRYFIVNELRKGLDDIQISEGSAPLGLAPSGPTKSKDRITNCSSEASQTEYGPLPPPPNTAQAAIACDIIPVSAEPPLPDPKPSPTFSASSLKGDPSFRTLDPSGATSPPPVPLPRQAHHVPTLRLVERPYIPPDLQIYQNTLGPMGTFRFRPRLATEWHIPILRRAFNC